MRKIEANQLFKQFGRAGLSERVFQLVKEFNEAPTYKRAMHLCGQLSAIADVADRDSYWSEKVWTGYHDEVGWMELHEAEVSKNESGDITSVHFKHLPTEYPKAFESKES